MLMKGCFIILIFCFFTLTSNSQNPQRQSLPLNERPKIGQITGRIVDEKSNQPVPYASVALVAKPDSVLAGGALCDEKGNFELQNTPTGRFWLRISFIGFKTVFKDSIFISPNNPTINLGVIRLSSSSTNLKEVNIIENQDLLLQNIDRRVFNVDQNIVTQGASATEVMQQVPGVSVDADGGISLRGSSDLNILIDGKPSTLTGGRNAILDQIPASSIERIEIITNPSAKYDADGGGGMINIILKKNTKPGINGSVNVNVGSREKYNGSINLNISNKKWNVTTSYSYRNDYRFNRGINERFNFFADTAYYLNTRNYGTNRNINHLIRTTFDYELSKTFNYSIGVTASTQSSKQGGDVDYDYLSPSFVELANSQRFNVQNNNGFNYELNGGFKKKFVKKQAEWTFDFNFSNNQGKDTAGFRQFFDDILIIPRPFQNNTTFSKSQIVTLQTDYNITIKKIKIESGLKYINRNIDNDFISNSRNAIDEAFVYDVGLSNHFVFNEQVAGAYTSLSGSLKNDWAYQAGLRAEQTFTQSDLITTNQQFNYDYFGLFPSAYLLKKYKDKSEFRAGYSRRINRPNARQLNPFPEYNDPFNLNIGNPFLRPEFTNSYEISHTYKTNSWNIYSSIYNRFTTGVTQRVRQVNDDGVAVTTFSNLNTRSASGGEVTVKWQAKKWIDMTGNLNVFYSILEGSISDQTLKNENWAWNTKLITNINTNKNLSFQISGNYMGPMVLAQGRSKPVYAIDFGLRKSLNKQNLTITANVSDIFDTREWGMETGGFNFISDNTRKRETRIFTIGLTWRIGKTEFQSKKRAKREEGGGNDGGGEGGDW